MNKKMGLLLLFLSVLFQSLSLIFGKHAALRMNRYTLPDYFTNVYYLLSMACLALQAVCWPLVLRRFPLFWSYVFMNAVYIVVLLAGYFIFHERVSAANAIGSAVIVSGILMVVLNGPEVGND